MPQSVNQRGRNKKRDLLLNPKDVFIEEDLSFTVEAQSLDPNNMKHDSNINFLQSILPEIQSLNDLQRFEFKLGVMRLIKRIRDNEEDGPSAPKDAMIENHGNCELVKSFECFPRSHSPLLLSVNRCNGQTSPNVNNGGMDVTSAKTLDVKSQDISKD